MPISDPSVPQNPNPKLNGQSKDLETTFDLTQDDNAKHIYESITDAEITCKPVTQPPSTQSDTSSTLDSNNPTAENIPKKESNYSRGGKYNLRPNPNPNYSEIYRYQCVQNFILAPFVCHFCYIILSFLHTLFNSFLSFWGIHKLPITSTKRKLHNKATED